MLASIQNECSKAASQAALMGPSVTQSHRARTSICVNGRDLARIRLADCAQLCATAVRCSLLCMCEGRLRPAAGHWQGAMLYIAPHVYLLLTIAYAYTPDRASSALYRRWRPYTVKVSNSQSVHSCAQHTFQTYHLSLCNINPTAASMIPCQQRSKKSGSAPKALERLCSCIFEFSDWL